MPATWLCDVCCGVWTGRDATEMLTQAECKEIARELYNLYKRDKQKERDKLETMSAAEVCKTLGWTREYLNDHRNEIAHYFTSPRKIRYCKRAVLAMLK